MGSGVQHRITEEMILLEREMDADPGEGFNSYEGEIDKVYDAARDSEVLDEGELSKELLTLSERTGIVDEAAGGYRVSGSTEDVEALEERLAVYSGPEYDRTELITRLKLESEKTYGRLSARDLDACSHMPSTRPYETRYGSWNNALWHAGLEESKSNSRETMLEAVIDTIRGVNEDKPVDEYDIPNAVEFDELEDGPTANGLRYLEGINSYEDALEEVGFARIRQEDGKTEDGRWEADGPDIERYVKKFLEEGDNTEGFFLRTQNFRYIDKLRNVASSDKRISVSADTRAEGTFYRALEEVGITEQWGSKTSNWIVKGTEADFRAVKREIVDRLGNEEISREKEMTKMVENAAERLEEPAVDEIEEHPESPPPQQTRRIINNKDILGQNPPEA